MVQAAAPSSSSYCFAGCSPCQAISEIIQRIAGFAASVFRAIAQFFTSGFSTPASAPRPTPLESTARITTSVSSPAPAPQPEVFVAQRHWMTYSRLPLRSAPLSWKMLSWTPMNKAWLFCARSSLTAQRTPGSITLPLIWEDLP